MCLVVVTLGMTASRRTFLDDYGPAIYALLYASLVADWMPKFICFLTVQVYSRLIGAPREVANALTANLLQPPPVSLDMTKEAKQEAQMEQLSMYIPIMASIIDFDEDVREKLKKFDAVELSKDFHDMEDYISDSEEAGNHVVDQAKIAMMLSTLKASLKVVSCIVVVSIVLRGVLYLTLQDSDMNMTYSHMFSGYVDAMYITLMERHWWTYLEHLHELMQAGAVKAISAFWLVV